MPRSRITRQLSAVVVPPRACQLLLGKVGLLHWYKAPPDLWMHGFHIVGLGPKTTSYNSVLRFDSSSTQLGMERFWVTSVTMQSLHNQFISTFLVAVYVAGALFVELALLACSVVLSKSHHAP